MSVLYSPSESDTGCLYCTLFHLYCILPSPSTPTVCTVYLPSISDNGCAYFQQRPPVPCTHPLFPTPTACAVYSPSISDTTACAVYSPSISDTDRLCCVLTLYFRHRSPVLCTHSLFPTPIACAVYSPSISDTDRLCCVLSLCFRHRPPDALFILTLCFQWAPACRRARSPACICPSFPWCTGRTSGSCSRW